MKFTNVSNESLLYKISVIYVINVIYGRKLYKKINKVFALPIYDIIITERARSKLCFETARFEDSKDSI